ncbi:MAG: hypothetical protein GY940_25535 [bacterium]|nr:hypothetical protein [bacterium]
MINKMTAHQLTFDINPDVSKLGVPGTYLVIKNLENRPKDDEFESYKTETLNQLSKQFNNVDVACP